MNEDNTLQEETNQAFDPNKLTRAQRRKFEKHVAAQEALQAKNRGKSVAGLMGNIKNLLSTYTTGYNEHAEKHPEAALRNIRMNIGINPTKVPLQEIVGNASVEELKALAPCIDAVDPSLINVMYFRVDTEYLFKEGTEMEARPDVPEEVKVNADGTVTQVQLFYHAACPLANESEPTTLIAQEKLLADFITHVFCMGVDMQGMNNNKLWQNKLQRQHDNLSQKAQEVEEMFSQIGEQNESMKVVS